MPVNFDAKKAQALLLHNDSGHATAGAQLNLKSLGIEQGAVGALLVLKSLSQMGVIPVVTLYDREEMIPHTGPSVPDWSIHVLVDSLDAPGSLAAGNQQEYIVDPDAPDAGAPSGPGQVGGKLVPLTHERLAKAHAAAANLNGLDNLPVRDPAPDGHHAYFEDATGAAKYPVLDGLVEVDVIPVDGTTRPLSVPAVEDMFWATGTGKPVLMVKRADGAFDPVGEFDEEYLLAMNGLILNGLGVLPGNVNFQTQGFTVDDSIKIGGSRYGWTKDTGVGQTSQLTIGDQLIPYNAATAKRLSFQMKWEELTNTGLPPERLFVYLAPFDRDGDPMARVAYYPSPFGANPSDYFANGNVTPEQADSAGPNIFLTAPLNPGDTVVQLNDVSFWEARKTTPTYRFLRFLNDQDATGRAYVNYSRNVPQHDWSPQTPDSTLWGQFTEFAIDPVMNRITLTHPWWGDTVPAGTQVASSQTGGTYNYLLVESSAQHTALAGEGQWREVSVVAPAAKDAEPFPDEVSAVKIGLLLNQWDNPASRPNPGSNYKYSLAAFFLGEGQTYTSPDGNTWELQVDNAGNVSATPL